MSRKKWIFFIVIDVIIIAALVMYFTLSKHTTTTADMKIDGIYLTTPAAINDFHLTDNTGKSFTKENLKGNWTFLFFGFTNCGMVCPMTMDALNKMYHTLQNELPTEQLPHIVMVSVDPDRDTLQRMNEYVTSFNPNFIGVRGEIQNTISLENQLHIVAAKMQADGKGKNHYSINHSAEILLVNPNAQLQAYLSYPHHPEQMVKDYKLILSVPNEPVLHTAQGQSVSIPSLKNKWVIINYWAPWCHNCMSEIAELNRFHQHNQNKNIFLFGMNYDQPPVTTLNVLIKKYHITYPVLIENPESIWQLGEMDAIPATFIINPKGEIAKKILGPVTEESLSHTLKTLSA